MRLVGSSEDLEQRNQRFILFAKLFGMSFLINVFVVKLLTTCIQSSMLTGCWSSLKKLSDVDVNAGPVQL